MYLADFLVHPNNTSNIEHAHFIHSLYLTKYNLVEVKYTHLYQQYMNKYMTTHQYFFQS
jgi:hypothetical protein